MNIFVLDKSPLLSARDHCDKHVCKMVIEVGQMLSTAHWLAWKKILKPPELKGQRALQKWLVDNVPAENQPLWKMTHAAHPCTQWAQRSWGNYRWLSLHGLELCREYTRRYNREHKSHEFHRWLYSHVPPSFEGMSSSPLETTPFAVAMPDEYKVPDDPVQSYRNYYHGSKSRFAKWKHTSPPPWWDPNTYLQGRQNAAAESEGSAGVSSG